MADLTTQPEFAFWFDDVGWNIANRGAEPDIEVEYTPADYARDPQLERALEELVKQLGDKRAPLEFGPRPSRNPGVARKPQ